MTDRRNRPIIRCAEPSCVSVGPWQASENRCPTHYAQLVAYLRAAVQRVRDRPDNPDPYSLASAALGGTHPKGNQNE